MNNRDGQVLTPSVAQELIIELFVGATVQKQEIVRAVDEAHTERGGQPPTAGVDRPVTHALSKMKQSGLAENPERGIWVIKPAQITTLAEFMKWAKRFNPGKYVFRGVRNETHGIQASAYRRPKKSYRDFDKFLKINKDLVDEAKLRGYNERDRRQLEDLEILANLQHYGAATCLIDFSYSAQVALWFACEPDSKTSQDCDSETSQDSENPLNGKVFAVHHRSSDDFEEIKSDSLSMEIDEFLQGSENSRLYHWQPRQQNNRIIAQQSIFLFGRHEFDAYDECVIEGSSKREILIELEQVSGITEAMLFPDFDGFARLRGVGVPYMQLSAYEYTDLAKEQFGIANYDEAIDYCDRAIDQDRDYAEAYYQRGLAKQHLNQHTSAISDFDRCTNLDFHYVDAYYYRAESKFHLRFLGEARADLQDALGIIDFIGDTRFTGLIQALLDEIDLHTAEGVEDE